MITSEGVAVLVTGGRAPATLELCRMLAESGCDIWLAESMPLTLSCFSRFVKHTYHVPSPVQDYTGYVRRLCEIVQRHTIRILIPTCEEAFYVARAAEQLESLCELMVPSFEVMASLHSKWAFQQLLKNNHLATTPSWRITNRQMLVRLLELEDPLVQRRWILKAEYSRFAHRVYAFTGRCMELPEDFDRVSWVLQPYVEGEEICLFAIVRDGAIRSYCAYRPLVQVGMGASISFESVDGERYLPWLERLVAETHYTGFIGIDLRIDSEGRLFPLECNPRLTSGIHVLGRRGEGVGWLLEDMISQNIALPHKTHSDIRIQCMLGLAMFGVIGYQLSSWQAFSRWVQAFMCSRDVVFRWDDPIPFWLQGLSAATLWWMARRRGLTVTEASTWDIEWNGER